MTKKELEAWIKSATFVCTGSHEYDQCANENVAEIWAKDGKFYKLEKCNRSYCEVWGKNGYIRGVYQPRECRKEERIIKTTVWVPVVRQEGIHP